MGNPGVFLKRDSRQRSECDDLTSYLLYNRVPLQVTTHYNMVVFILIVKKYQLKLRCHRLAAGL